MQGMDPYLGMIIVNQYMKKAEQEAANYRLHPKTGAISSGRVSYLGRRLVGRAGRWLSTAGSWLEQQDLTSELPLDGNLGRTV